MQLPSRAERYELQPQGYSQEFFKPSVGGVRRFIKNKRNQFMNHKLKVLCIAGARPNFMKIAPLMKEMKKYQQIKAILVHTGQHYDYGMSQTFFRELKISKPKYNLKIGSDSHIRQTARIMEKLEPIFLKEKPNLVIVVGDVNSTLAGALTAAKLCIPIAHVEAGLRSFDMSMPEEINRRLVDHISSFLFVTEPSGVKNLLKEGISRKKIYLVGNIMIDTLKQFRPKIKDSKILKKLNLRKKNYAVLTLHRPSNVDNLKSLGYFLNIFTKIQDKIKIVFPIHPRTKKILELENRKSQNLGIINPLSYLDFIALVHQSRFVLTDSGGIQEETTFLGIPCLTLRKNTERPITIIQGTNILCGNKEKILKEVDKILKEKYKKTRVPKFWDGKTAKRIVKIINEAIK